MNRSEMRIEHLEEELRGAARSIYNQRQENAELIRQVQELQAEDRSITDLKKEIKAQESNTARIRFNGKRAKAQRDTLYLKVKEEVAKLHELAAQAYEAEEDHKQKADIEIAVRLNVGGRTRERIAQDLEALLDESDQAASLIGEEGTK